MMESSQPRRLYQQYFRVTKPILIKALSPWQGFQRQCQWLAYIKVFNSYGNLTRLEISAMFFTHIQAFLVLTGFLTIQAAVVTAIEPHTSSFVTSQDQTRIFTEARGNKDGPHIILAPGFATTARSLDPLFNEPLLYNKFYLVRRYMAQSN
jgi:hypothetical protein